MFLFLFFCYVIFVYPSMSSLSLPVFYHQLQQISNYQLQKWFCSAAVRQETMMWIGFQSIESNEK